jgi:hypothetical protein
LGVAEVKQNVRRDRIFGNLSAKYDFTDWLFAQVSRRTGLLVAFAGLYKLGQLERTALRKEGLRQHHLAL